MNTFNLRFNVSGGFDAVTVWNPPAILPSPDSEGLITFDLVNLGILAFNAPAVGSILQSRSTLMLAFAHMASPGGAASGSLDMVHPALFTTRNIVSMTVATQSEAAQPGVIPPKGFQLRVSSNAAVAQVLSISLIDVGSQTDDILAAALVPKVFDQFLP